MSVDGTSLAAALRRRPAGLVRGEPWPVVTATGGDHPAIFYLLSAVCQGPTRAEFNASLDDPFYEPRDRLLLKRGGRLIAHVHVGHRTLQADDRPLSAAVLGWLAVLPEHQGQGHGRRLLHAATEQMAADGALVGLVRTAIPHFFRTAGWALCGQHSYSRAGARALLAILRKPGSNGCRGIAVRPWRRTEFDALMAIYNRNLSGTRGGYERTRAYWEWLVRRHAYDRIYVAQRCGRRSNGASDAAPAIVGYAILRGDRILELFSLPRCEAAQRELLVRACRDAIECDNQDLILHGPPGSSLHRLFVEAGGRQVCQGADRGEVFMARLLNPLRLLRQGAGEGRRRAMAAGLALPLDLGLIVDGARYHVHLGPRHAKVGTTYRGRSRLRLSTADFTRLLLGQLDCDRAAAEGRIAASSASALAAARALFPYRPLWYPPLDDLPA